MTATEITIKNGDKIYCRWCNSYVSIEIWESKSYYNIKCTCHAHQIFEVEK